MVRTEADVIVYQLIFFHHLHPRIHHNNYHHIIHQLIFLYHLALVSTTTTTIILSSSTIFSQPPLVYTLATINESVTCVVQRLQYNQKTFNTPQQYQIFYSRCSVKSKICNLFTDKRISFIEHLWTI